MTDPFETLSLPVRPWIDKEFLQNRFLELASKCHPDASSPNQPGQSNDRFVTLNAAHRTLQDPVTRIQKLLEKEAPDPAALPKQQTLSPVLTDLFMTVATILRGAASFREQQTISRSPLTRAVLRAENHALKKDVEKTLSKLDDLWHQCENQLQGADAVWDRRTPQMLHQLATVQQEMSFLQKWRLQLKEALLQMSE